MVICSNMMDVLSFSKMVAICSNMLLVVRTCGNILNALYVLEMKVICNSAFFLSW